MKLVTRKDILHNERVRLKKERRKAKKRRVAKMVRQLRKVSETLIAPKEIGIFLRRRRVKTLQFLYDLRTAVRNSSKEYITIDFSQTDTCISDGTLLLKSEICRLKKHLRGKKKLRCIPPTSKKIQQVFQQVGIFKLLGHTSSIKATRDDVIYWSHAHGNEVDGSKYDDILGNYEGQIPEALATGLFKGITEAMTNCHHHAYEEPRKDGLGINDRLKDWWMFSQKKDGNLEVVFCDLGMGIPRSLPIKKPKLWKKIASLGMIENDGEIIKEAIDHSITRTGFKWRGKGLKQLVEAINGTPNALMVIYSNKGCYALRHGEEAKVVNFSKSIFGTLVAWQIPLKTVK